MTTKEMKVAKSRDQLALQPLEGVDLSPEQDEGVLKFIKQEGPGMEMPKIGEELPVGGSSGLVERFENVLIKPGVQQNTPISEFFLNYSSSPGPYTGASSSVLLERSLFSPTEATHTRGTRRRSLFNHLAGRSIWAVASSTPAHRAPEVDKVTEGRLVKAVQLGTVHAERLSLDGRVSQVSSSEETVFIPHLSAEPNTAASLLKIAFIVTTKKLLIVVLGLLSVLASLVEHRLSGEKKASMRQLRHRIRPDRSKFPVSHGSHKVKGVVEDPFPSSQVK
ncbi:hypothetical protein JEQ12_019404 [Ovis aries]|uniref:Uncharacterized protein n=1 Tax=Ovis aries TaxID=9940 RepID=A0A836D0I1_SHEEP|nr:hypothetical protein JEQ12_019404 [Ovis aries]